jgi:phosphoglucomutase/phosphomannomutase
MTLDPKVEETINAWLKPPFDDETKRKVKELLEKDKQLALDAFYTTLSFGTGGLRGLMGPGTNRMNRYTVRMATQGLANYLLKTISSPSVVIGFDSRNNSELFAWEAAKVLAANNIHVYLIKELRPTPYISFACRQKKASAAIMITASHNPAAYNGYKVYWADGGQIVPPHDTGIIDEVKKIGDLGSIPVAKDNDPNIELIDPSFDELYYKAINPLQLFPQDNKASGKDLKITFTGLHGTGQTLVPHALRNWGFSSMNFVEQQMQPDGNFPTVKVPNPEFRETLQMGIDQLQETNSDILLATDPDGDRLGAVVRHHGEPIILTGNQIASICVHYICATLAQRHKLPKNGAVVTTIVSTDLIKKVANSFHVTCFEVLTGFKYIAEKIREWESEAHSYHFLFGAEESYGFLYGTHARDKDAAITSCLLAEIALQAKLKGNTLIDVLHEIYQAHGVYQEKQLSISFEPTKTNMEKMATMMQNLRSHLPTTFCGQKVHVLEDYKEGQRHLLLENKSQSLSLPASNVLLFRLEDGSKVVIRPSGTEPKIKIYACVHVKEFSSIDEALKRCTQKLDDLLQTAKKDLGA